MNRKFKFKFTFIIIIVLISNFIISKEVFSLQRENEGKIVYLTFDDLSSPSITNEILKVLEKNNVKATFFIMGSKVRDNPEVIKKINDNGMSIMPHIYMHDYNHIYDSCESYLQDLKNCEESIKSLTGKTNFNFIRMPGGSDNTIAKSDVLDEFRSEIINKNKYYIDYSVDIGDTQTTENTVDFIESRIREYGGLYKVEVVLMHDLQNKLLTIQGLQKTIDFYKERGYDFKNLDNIEKWEIDYLKNIKVINK